MPDSAPRVAVIGGGQLARMMAQPAIALGVPLRLLAEAEGGSAAQVIPDQLVGDYRDLATLRQVTDDCVVVTFDHEHVPTEHLHALEDAGVACRPGPEALVHAQDKIVMREAMARLGAPQPRWAVVASAGEVASVRVPLRPQGQPRRLRRQGRLGRPIGRRPRRAARGGRAGRRTAARRGAGRLPARAGRAGRPRTERPGGGVPRRRLDPARRHLPRGDRSGTRPRPGPRG